MRTGHVVLLGDAIFDNAAYVAGEPDVVHQLQDALPSGWRATLRAMEGEVTENVPAQLRSVPADTTHLVVSVGGNDALGVSAILQQPADTVGDGLLRLAEVQQRFAADYEAMLDTVLGAALTTAVCTIYDTRPSGPGYPLVKTGISLFNDCITRSAFVRGVTVVDLRLICTETGDYANPIELAAQGGAKVARAVAGWLLDPTGAGRSTVVAS